MDDVKAGLLTIGIPTFNGGFNFEELFQSILNLGLRDEQYEILVVDNASTDDTVELINSLKTRYPNLRFHRNETNIGRTENWDRVVELAQGEYLIIMNVNDRFLKFDVSKYLRFLTGNLNVAMVLADIHIAYDNSSHLFPNFRECGVIKLTDYINKTFLDPEYLEYNSLGLLQQHIFRTDIITRHKIKFDNKIPRTTDRVFVGEVVAAGGGLFYYTNEVIVKWQINNKRFHHDVHLNNKTLDLDFVWMNEYKANSAVAKIANISTKDFLKGQLSFALFFMYKCRMSKVAKLVGLSLPPVSIDEQSAHIYYDYIKLIAKLNGIAIDKVSVVKTALYKSFKLPLQKLKIVKHAERSIKDIVTEVSLT